MHSLKLKATIKKHTRTYTPILRRFKCQDCGCKQSRMYTTGRPPMYCAECLAKRWKTPAERQKAYRDRKRAAKEEAKRAER